MVIIKGLSFLRGLPYINFYKSLNNGNWDLTSYINSCIGEFKNFSAKIKVILC